MTFKVLNMKILHAIIGALKCLGHLGPYYEQAKKNLMAYIRQKGCPSLFLTIACAEYKWDVLLKEILQVKENL